MSNIISIDELRKEFLEKNKPKDIKEFVHKQQELLEKFIRENEVLKEKLKQSEDLLRHAPSAILIGKQNNEEIICVEQIDILKERGFVKSGDVVINTGSTPVSLHLPTNLIKLTKVN